MVLLMDEPCSALDPTSTRRIEDTIREIKDEVTIVIVTHNMQQAARVSEQCAFFLAQQGTPGVMSRQGGRRRSSPRPTTLAPRTTSMVASAELRNLLDPLDVPISPQATNPLGDRVFHLVVRGIAGVVLVIFGSIGIFLAYQSIPTFRRYGLSFLTQSQWNPELDVVGISSTLLGTVEVALVALIVAFPIALATALFISEYAPLRFKGLLVALVDLIAAVPSVIYGAWGFFLLMPHASLTSRFISEDFGWIPIFKVNTDPAAAIWAQSCFVNSAFIAGLCVSMMVIPITCSVMRGVFAEAPLGEREAATPRARPSGG